MFSPTGDKPGALNLWKGWKVTPDAAGSCALFLQHIRDVVCYGNVDQSDYVIGWLADIVQNPGRKPGVGLVLRGNKGAGKDTVAEYMARIIGRAHVPVVSDPRHLTGRFNAHMESALLIHVQEGAWAGDHAAENILKANVTSDSVTIERKGVDAITLPSLFRVFISSNSEWVVPATADERRWAVFDVCDAKRGDRAYFDALYAEMEGGGPAALLHYLQNLDLSQFDVRTPPETAGLARQKIASLRNVEKWWHSVLQDGDLPADNAFDSGEGWEGQPITIDKARFRGIYESWLQKHRYEGEPLDSREFGKRLRIMLPGLGEKRSTSKGQRVRQYVISHLDEARGAFSKYIGYEIDWAE